MPLDAKPVEIITRRECRRPQLHLKYAPKASCESIVTKSKSNERRTRADAVQASDRFSAFLITGFRG